MDTLLCNDDGDIVLGTYQPSNTLLSLSADQYTAGSATWSDQSGNGLDFTVSTNASLKGTDTDGFPYMNFGGSYGIAKRIVSSALTNITAPTTNKYTIFCVTQILNSTASHRTLTRGATEDHMIIVETGTNNLGLWDNNGSNFVDSGFDVTTDMTSTRNLLVWELSTSSPIYKFQLNESGTDSTITSATNYTLPFASLGGYHNGSTVITTSSQYWGNIYEFIVYDGVLSASERVYVAEYLTYKWGITSKLPSFTSTQGVITNEETLAFLYAGSGTETTYTWDAEGVTYADILVVGGGGGGSKAPSSNLPAGGGGGGEVVFRQGVPVTPGVEIKVGRGGPTGDPAPNGGISQFTSAIQANGGGRSAASGGSGGGAHRYGGEDGGATSELLSIDGLGNKGGGSSNSTSYRGGGGGGGATQIGFTTYNGGGGNGGEGYTANVFGIYNDVYGSGGGGGGRSGGGGTGGTNGGHGTDQWGNGSIDATPHRGGGGGGGGANNSRRGGSNGGSGIVLVKPNPGALDGLGSSVYTQAVGAYALRRLFGAYTGAQVRLRRSTDNEETDVYFDKYGYPVNFDVETWLEGGTGYVVTWYDQGPNATHTTGYGTTLPSIYHRGGGTYAVYFPGTSATAGGYFNAGSVTLNIATNGGVSTFSRVNFLGANSYERVYDYGNNLRDDNLLLFRSGTSNNLVFEMYEGIGTDRSSITVSNGILNNTWQSFGNRIQGSGSSWIFSTRIDGTENTSAISRTYTDRTITRSYIGRSNWSDSYSNMYLACQIFFNTGSITSEQFGVMENVLY
jgi:hypothetical protein